MKAMTVVQFANWLNVISSDINGKDRAINLRLYKLAMWTLEQAEMRGALNMRIRDFMARCPANVRDAARALVREAQAARNVVAKPAATKKAVRRVKDQAAAEKRFAEQERREAERELIARMDLGDAIAYVREL